jgi:acyl phosphate:glycerol-3-phosphate acyltransferase
MTSVSVFPILLGLILGYLLGSIPFGILVTRAAGAGDIRSIGSGNIGATNVLRTGRKSLAALTLLGDGGKGLVAVLLCTALWGAEAGLAAALGAFLGHLFPVWLGFKGGKGVATYLGLLFAFSWPVALAFMVIWLGVAALFRFSSLAALVAAAASPFLLWAFASHDVALLFAVLSALVVVMHRANIGRLMAGTEPRIGAKSRAS